MKIFTIIGFSFFMKKSDISDEEGLQAELKQAIKTLQIKDLKCEELTQENLRVS